MRQSQFCVGVDTSRLGSDECGQLTGPRGREWDAIARQLLRAGERDGVAAGGDVDDHDGLRVGELGTLGAETIVELNRKREYGCGSMLQHRRRLHLAARQEEQGGKRYHAHHTKWLWQVCVSWQLSTLAHDDLHVALRTMHGCMTPSATDWLVPRRYANSGGILSSRHDLLRGARARPGVKAIV
jgi:hypothetical protein